MPEEEALGAVPQSRRPRRIWICRNAATLLFSSQRYIDYFNLMSYDIHGMWELDNEWIGPYLKGHTDWRKIEEVLELLWRNGVCPEKVIMGFGFYGRSFTIEDPSCDEPNGVCRISDGGAPGSCTDTARVLTYYEVTSRNETGDVETYSDARNTVKYSVFGGDQCISYDDQQSFHDKLLRLSENCLGGLMIWSIDQDTAQYDALHGLLGELSTGGLDGSTDDETLSDFYGQFTGQDCMVTVRCSSGSMSETHEDYDCPSGYRGVTLAHNPVQR
ncbi:uncharacterized protein J7T54_001966 [Emericellopsis cladophorae]|uniref:chitinase n=1 Tax=Emericellopsis cladophorae TaxID=2686198 RepID=A0A9P9XXW1_9HYPO|nr:uncharacterized protein J7T54_001966 [Emericellopsis cladophorae]KAI6779878.1 hypothetical protein J7T54_001966 [Emericellopsis cladophorae]